MEVFWIIIKSLGLATMLFCLVADIVLKNVNAVTAWCTAIIYYLCWITK